MNIIITLPSDLAEAIYDGKKRIELRKSYPLKFNIDSSYVFICEKGTNLVTGCFRIFHHFKSEDTNFIWKVYGSLISIEKKWFDRYTSKKQSYHLWVIGYVLKFKQPYSLTDVFGLEKAPQQYAYIKSDSYFAEPWDPY